MMKKSNLALLYCTFFLSQLSHAEYLIYKEVGWRKEIKTLSEYEHEQVYNVLLRNQWPTCLIFDKENDSVMYSRLRKASDAQKKEHERIESQIQGLQSELRVVYIPTILYELFTIFSNSVYGLGHNISKLAINRIRNIKDWGGKSPDARKRIIRDVLLDSRVCSIHRTINNTFLEFVVSTPSYKYNCDFLCNRDPQNPYRAKKRLMPFSLFLDRFAPQCINQLLIMLTKTKHAPPRENEQQDIFATLLPLLQYPKVVRRLIELERKAHNRDQALVYHSITNCADFAFGQLRMRPVEIPAMLAQLPVPFRGTRLKECVLSRYFELENKMPQTGKQGRRGDEMVLMAFDAMRAAIEQNAQTEKQVHENAAEVRRKREPAMKELEVLELSTLRIAIEQDSLNKDLTLRNVSKLSNSNTSFLANFFDTENSTLYTDLMLPKNPDNDLTASTVLFVDKKRYATDNAWRKLFPVAPINTLIGLFLNKETVACMAAALNLPPAEAIENPQEQHPDTLFEQAMEYAKFVSTHGNIHILKVPNDEESVSQPTEQEQQSQLEPPPYEQCQDRNLLSPSTISPQGTATQQEFECLDVQNAGGFCPESEIATEYMHDQKTLLAVLKVLRGLRTFRRCVQAMAQMRAGIEAAEIQS